MVKGEKICIWSLWLYVVLIVTFLLHPLLTPGMVTGWDLVPHYEVFQVFLSNISRGSISGYDTLWFCGYPSFTFYGFIPYLFASFIYWLTPSIVTEVYALNLYIYILPFIFLLAMLWSGKKLCSKGSLPFIFLFSLLFLLGPDILQGGPYGIKGSLAHGHIASFTALILMIFFIGSLKLLEAEGKKGRYSFLTGIILALLFMSHAMTSIFSVIFLIFSFILLKDIRKPVFLSSIIALLLSSFFWFPFVSNLAFTSGSKEGAGVKDLLLYLFPEIDKVHQVFSYGGLTEVLFALPVGIIFLLICSVAGVCVFCKRKNWILPFFLIFGIVFLPRNFLTDVIPFLPFHYDRFIMPLWVINIFVAAEGASFLFSKAKESRVALQVLSLFALTIVFYGILLQELTESLQYVSSNQNIKKFAGIRDYTLGRENWHFPMQKLNEMPKYIEARKIVEFLVSEKPKGRVAVESAEGQMEDLGSPHFFTTLLASKGIPSYPGLLAESSYSTGFLNPIVAYKNKGLKWGRRDIARYLYSNRGSFNMEAAIERMADAGIEYLVADSAGYVRNLSKLSESRKDRKLKLLSRSRGGAYQKRLQRRKKRAPILLDYVWRTENYSIFKLKKFRPLIVEHSQKPFLFVKRDGLKYREFAELLYGTKGKVDVPIIYTRKKLQDLPREDLARIGGLIISCSLDSLITVEELSYWESFNKPIIIVNGLVAGITPSELTTVINPFTKSGFLERDIRKALSGYAGSGKENVVKESMGEDIVTTNRRLEFQSDQGIEINLSFASGWQSPKGTQEVYILYPWKMFLFGEGLNVLEYRK